MTVILVTQDIGWQGREMAASIAAGLGLELVSEEQLGELVAARMQIDQGTFRRLIGGSSPLFARWLGERRRLAWHTGNEIAKLAERGDVVVQCWNGVGSSCGIQHGIHVHIGQPTRIARQAGRLYTCQATIRLLDRSPARAWGLACGREPGIVCDLGLAPVPQSVAVCVHHLRQLAFDLPWAPNRSARPDFASGLDAVGRRTDDSKPWSRTRARHALEVEIGWHRMPLAGAASSEQAIAQIEEHLQGKNAAPAPGKQRLPLPPGIL
jgi:hypothetical protein